jgi:hypothetical protein
MTPLRALLLTIGSALLAVVALGGLYRAIQAAPARPARPALAAPVSALSPSVTPARLPAESPAFSGDDYEYCRPGVPPLRLGAGGYDAVFALGAGLAIERVDTDQIVGDGARLRPLAAWLAVTRFAAAPTLGLSGGRTSGPAAPSEAASMRRFLETPAFRSHFGRLATAVAQPREVVLEEESLSTETNVSRIADLAARRGWGRVLLVTNQYHVPRTRLLAEIGHLAADVVSAESVVDAGVGDPALHDLLCAHEREAGTDSAIRRERTYMTVMGLLRS